MEKDFNNAVNIYRTKYYIVKQKITLSCNANEDNVLASRDTFVRRNNMRDLQFDILFANKTNKDGRRIPTSMSTRKYKD